MKLILFGSLPGYTAMEEFVAIAVINTIFIIANIAAIIVNFNDSKIGSGSFVLTASSIFLLTNALFYSKFKNTVMKEDYKKDLTTLRNGYLSLTIINSIFAIISILLITSGYIKDKKMNTPTLNTIPTTIPIPIQNKIKIKYI